MFAELQRLADSIPSRDLAVLPDAHLEEDFALLHRVVDRLQVERLRWLDEIERRGLHERDGHVSVVSWLANTQGVSRGAAAKDIRVARALREMPETERALDSAEVTLYQVKVLSEAQRFDPHAFGRSESLLLEAARTHPIDDLHRIVGHWRHRVEATRLSDDTLHEGRGLHASVTFGGMVRVDGNLDPETGESLIAALGSVLDADARTDEDDRRTPAQRRADALGEICRSWLDRSDRPTVAGERPHVTVTVDLNDLVDGHSGELERTGPVNAGTVRRLACDASVVRVVMAGRSEALDVGRRTPVVSPAMRRALIARDRGCRFPGCDRPHAWCDAHHVRHWADGGPTAVTNLLLLCRRHHRRIHEGFGVQMESGRPVFSRPDGTVLADRAPPSRAA